MLEKLDLTVNFVYDLGCLDSLKGLAHLRDLYLVGNPCAAREGYRLYVIKTLEQLKVTVVLIVSFWMAKRLKDLNESELLSRMRSCEKYLWEIELIQPCKRPI